MYGNIIGDLTGSIYEYKQIKKVSHITIDKLITNDSFISDDAILNGKKYEEKLKEYGHKYEDYVKIDIPSIKNIKSCSARLFFTQISSNHILKQKKTPKDRLLSR